MDLRKWSENSNLRFWTCLNSKLFWVITSTDKTFKFKPFKHFLLRLYVETGTRTAQVHPSQTFSLFFFHRLHGMGARCVYPFSLSPLPPFLSSSSCFKWVFCSPLLSFPDIRSLPSCLLASSYSRSSTTVSAAYNLSCLSVSLLFISFCLLFSTVFIVLFLIFSRAQKCYLFHEFS